MRKLIYGLLHSNDRSNLARRQILLSIIARGVSFISSFLIVPLTISYVNQTQYGIWLTISSIVGWMSYFDFGLGNGFRNRYAEAKAANNTELCRQYLSTTYIAIFVVISIVWLIALVSNSLLDWTKLLKVDISYYNELRKVFGIVCSFFCLNMVVSLFTTFLTAEQRSGVAALISGAGQFASLAVIFLLTKISEGSLINLALYYSGIPCVIMIIASLYAFRFTKYRDMKPSIRYVNVKLIKDILGLGVKFFLIYMCMLLVFQTINVVISRELGADAVTQYNVAYKYFSIIYTTIYTIVAPYWTAFTDAYAKKDISWMKKTVKNLENIWLLFVFISVLVLAVSGFVFRIWVGDSVDIPLSLSIAMMIYAIIQSISNIYMYLIDGVGTITVQLIVYCICALLAVPGLIFACRYLGLYGAIIIPTTTYLAQAIFGKIQLNKILEGRAEGIWGK